MAMGSTQQIVDSGRAGHWGLRGMRERAKAMGAELNIRSHPGAGTEVELTIPAEVAYPDTHQEIVLVPDLPRVRAETTEISGTGRSPVSRGNSNPSPGTGACFSAWAGIR